MFPCTKCGACCKRAGETGLMPARKDGSCIYLNKDNTCSIYSKRPDICKINKAYKIFNFHKNLSKKQYYKLTAEQCNKFIDEDGLDSRYKIDVDSI